MTTKQEIKTRLLETGLFYDNEFLNDYCELIASNRFTYWTHNKSYEFPYHHILPKNISKVLNQPVDNSLSNLIVLTKDLHRLAHLYLNRCCKFNTVESKVIRLKNGRLLNEAKEQTKLEKDKIIKIIKDILL